LAADAGYWQLPRLDAPRLGDDVVVKGRDGDQGAAPNSPLALDIVARLGRHFRFSGAGLDARLAGRLHLTAVGHDLPRANGTIRAVDGRFEAYGQKLHIERGILAFSGLVDNPALDVLAVRRGLPVTPGVEVTGSVRRPQVRLVSDPDMPDAEKLSWLVLGRAPDQAGADDTSLLLAAADSLFGGESGGVVHQLKRNFGIEDLGVRSGELGDDGRAVASRVVGGGSAGAGASTQIFSVGKRLSANTLLTYEQALGTTESLVKLTLMLSRRLSLVGRAGADNAVDLFYTFTFGR
jgi:translocation and assembly module TamB